MTMLYTYVSAVDVPPEGPPRVIGYVDRTLPGWLSNEQLIRKHATDRGYFLVRIVVHRRSDVDDPMERLLAKARGYNVAAVIVPNLGHLGGDPSRVRAVCDVETADPAETFTRVGGSGRGERRVEDTVVAMPPRPDGVAEAG
ncbi:hypothetical protein [Nocardia sp. BMG51109]|uniref:hypothetical protein n=1 Tax=Nocardia sp. BMG51109 TaxID=1056816 RepID=UPI000467AE85|nr:hypothetical protein [Nocardia sp. BMG51109]